MTKPTTPQWCWATQAITVQHSHPIQQVSEVLLSTAPLMRMVLVLNTWLFRPLTTQCLVTTPTRAALVQTMPLVCSLLRLEPVLAAEISNSTAKLLTQTILVESVNPATRLTTPQWCWVTQPTLIQHLTVQSSPQLVAATSCSTARLMLMVVAPKA